MINHPRRRFTRAPTHRENGAVLPIVALLIVILLVFAAFTVDFGAAWAKRRQLQSAADAGAEDKSKQLSATDPAIANAGWVTRYMRGSQY